MAGVDGSRDANVEEQRAEDHQEHGDDDDRPFAAEGGTGVIQARILGRRGKDARAPGAAALGYDGMQRPQKANREPRESTRRSRPISPPGEISSAQRMGVTRCGTRSMS